MKVEFVGGPHCGVVRSYPDIPVRERAIVVGDDLDEPIGDYSAYFYCRLKDDRWVFIPPGTDPYDIVEAFDKDREKPC